MYGDFPIDIIRKIELQKFLLIPIDMPYERALEIHVLFFVAITVDVFVMFIH